MVCGLQQKVKCHLTRDDCTFPVLFVLMLYVLVNKFSAMSGPWLNQFLAVNKGHITVTPPAGGLELVTL